MQHYYYVYRITCTHPASLEKYYYGLRCSKCHPKEDTRYWSSSRYVKEAINQFGSTYFTKKIVSIYSTREQALLKEIQLHAFFDVKNHPLFFNRANQTTIKFSTLGLFHSNETKTKIRRALLGKPRTYLSLESREKMAKARLGKLVSEEIRAKMSIAHSNQAELNPNRPIPEETRLKMSIAHTGKKYPNRRSRGPQSSETRKKISDSLKQTKKEQKRKSSLEHHKKSQETLDE